MCSHGIGVKRFDGHLEGHATMGFVLGSAVGHGGLNTVAVQTVVTGGLGGGGVVRSCTNISKVAIID